MLTEKDVYRYFGATYAGRGDVYARTKRVLQPTLDLETLTFSGDVQGMERYPYAVQVRLARTGGGIEDVSCTCPMGGLCKHSAALLLHSIRNGIVASNHGPSSDVIPVTTSVDPVDTSAESQRAQLSPQLASWVDGLAASMVEREESIHPSHSIDSVLYLLDVSNDRHQLKLNAGHARWLKRGGWGQPQTAHFERLAVKGAAYVTDDDCEIAKLFLSNQSESSWSCRNSFPELPEISLILLDRIISTGRCYWQKVNDTAIKFGPRKKAILQWETLANGKQVLRFDSGDEGDITAIAGVGWYVNPKEAVLGPLEIPVPIKAVKSILNAPAVEPHEALAAAEALSRIGATIPKPTTDFVIETVVVTPTPKLKLISQETNGWNFVSKQFDRVPLALVNFDYGEVKFDGHGPAEKRTVQGNKILIQKKDSASEARFLKDLAKLGLTNLGRASLFDQTTTMGFPGANEADWLSMSLENLPHLKEKGWVVEVDRSFNYQVVVPEEEWEADAKSGSDFWFSLNLGISIDGKKVPLLPIIQQALLRVVGADPLTEIERMNKNGIFYAQLKDGRHVALPFERVKSIVTVLLELFDKNSSMTGSHLDVSVPQVVELVQAISPQSSPNFKWALGKNLAILVQKINDFQGLKPSLPPKTFLAQLRPYQLEGLSWLNFLREFELGGILADDMGLGKTVQTLAHIALEKHENRVDKPFLVICPTSVMPNWLNEIEKFAPNLKVTALWGPDRSNSFPKIVGSDIVVTTYPLIARDIDTLAKKQWKAIVLDEAQAIKNPTTQVAQAVARLRSNYRICLTGTPVENHLGELWSQFNFLMPGLLKDLKTFTKNFRTPIEKQKNKLTQKVLAAKVRPFLLRRTKELVAKDLPDKTVIIKKVELEGSQRDLYETVRLAMYEKVKQAVEAKGLAKSQIIILDALLKLRQVCCDPRLVALPAAKKVEGTAKLSLLLEMLEELVDEGKRILLFSQFTSMLDLIIPELTKRGIDFVEIRGDTKDRATPVKSFQAGLIPIFLLSLKAGGTGLNLTAADTVIHYDPWWNPAVENQATDRAHRIGQDKAVFVFKLIASGTIEERMLELQDRKRAIADGVYGDENALPAQLTAADLESLFTPLVDSAQETSMLRVYR